MHRVWLNLQDFSSDLIYGSLVGTATEKITIYRLEVNLTLRTDAPLFPNSTFLSFQLTLLVKTLQRFKPIDNVRQRGRHPVVLLHRFVKLVDPDK